AACRKPMTVPWGVSRPRGSAETDAVAGAGGKTCGVCGRATATTSRRSSGAAIRILRKNAIAGSESFRSMMKFLAAAVQVLRPGRGCLRRRSELVSVLLQEKLIGHPGNVVASDDVARDAQGLLLVIGRHGVGLGEKKVEQALQAGHRVVAILGN